MNNVEIFEAAAIAAKMPENSGANFVQISQKDYAALEYRLPYATYVVLSDDQSDAQVVKVVRNGKIAYHRDLKYVTVTVDEPYSVVKNDRNCVHVSYVAELNHKFTSSDYGILYCNDGSVSDDSLLTLANVDGVSIKKSANKTGTNLVDRGYGVVAVGYAVLIDADNDEFILYTGNIGGRFEESN